MFYSRHLGFRFNREEVKHLVISWLVISFCFSAGYIYMPRGFLLVFLVSLGTAGLGFIVHELSHKYTAQKFGYIAEYRAWMEGLILAVLFALLTRGRIVFAAPGAVYITPPLYYEYFREPERENGLISVSGPLSNAALAFLFLTLRSLPVPFYIVWDLGFSVNAWLALFNLIPFPPLDGIKVFKWNKGVWAMLFTALLLSIVFL